jgi:hypothetical protein
MWAISDMLLTAFLSHNHSLASVRERGAGKGRSYQLRIQEEGRKWRENCVYRNRLAQMF